MSELSTAARNLVEEAKALNAEIDVFDDPPSRTQIEALQDALNELQRRLNRIRSRPTHGRWPATTYQAARQPSDSE